MARSRCSVLIPSLRPFPSHLRVDALAQMLTMCNVHAHSNIIAMETCQGLLVGALLERMGGKY